MNARPESVLSHEVIVITPLLAKQMLVHNRVNRPLSRRFVEYYARQIREGNWSLNGNTIKFDEHGNLIDGQHRLHAIILAGIAASTIVVRGLDEHTQTTIDIQKVRSAGDSFHLYGIQNANRTAAIVRMIWLWRQGLFTSPSMNSNKASPDELLAEYRSGAGEIEAATHWAGRCAKDLFIQQSLAGFIFWLLHKADHDIAERFFQELIEIPTGTLLVLRKRMTEDRLKRRSVSTLERAALFVKSWNAFCENREMKILRWVPKEGFPDVAGMADEVIENPR